ncbi:hypothetical protein E6H12_07110 [Candidatus Bathyarchaeota archaeon]|nr:MAG: hypothetical protein E6H12_07110 [Candidatus Bathyarchaeota archaeon]
MTLTIIGLSPLIYFGVLGALVIPLSSLAPTHTGRLEKTKMKGGKHRTPYDRENPFREIFQKQAQISDPRGDFI